MTSTVFRPGAAVRLSGRAQDVGEGGLRGEISGAVLPGECVEVRMLLPGSGQAMRTRAVVRHISGPGCGLEFLSLAQTQRERLQGLSGVALNDAELKPGLAPPPRSRTILCEACGFEYPEEAAGCVACGAAQSGDEEPSQNNETAEGLKPAPATVNKENSNRRRDATLDSAVAVIFLVTLCIGLWQWLQAPAKSAHPSSVTLELEHMFRAPRPTNSSPAAQRVSRPNPELAAAKSFVTAMIGTITPVKEQEPIGSPGSAASEIARREAPPAYSRPSMPERSAAVTSSASAAAPPPAATATSASEMASQTLTSAANAAGQTLVESNSGGSERSSGSTLAGMLLQKVLPLYPTQARKQGVQGEVVLKAVIGKDGMVQSLQPLQGPQELSAAAIDAVQHWRFRPYEFNGKPVAVETNIRLNFKLPK